MANRAYLFVSNREEGDPRTRGEYPEDWYYNSRWCIPLAWFFFFDPRDVRLAPVKDWHEVLFVASKPQALLRFDRRLSLLRSLVDASVDWDRVVFFRDDLEAIIGLNLILDPSEILMGFEGEDAWHVERFQNILDSLDKPLPLDPTTLDLLDAYVGPRDQDADRTLGQMVGYTYARENRDQRSK
jgi:hypothetical protein